MENDNKKNDIKLKLLSAAINLGHEVYAKKDLFSAASCINNHSKSYLSYDRASLICILDSISIINISGQSDVNNNSEYAVALKKLLILFTEISETVILNSEKIKELGLSEKMLANLNFSYKNDSEIALVPILSPDKNEKGYIWVIEYFNGIKEGSLSFLTILARNYSESIWYHTKLKKNSLFDFKLRDKRLLSKEKIFLYVIIVIILLFVIRIRENIPADFELVSGKYISEYAPMQGIVENLLLKNGSTVTKGETILKYDTRDLDYQLLTAENKFLETATILDVVRQKSFSDKNELGQVKILSLKEECEKIDIEKIKYYLSKSEIKAEQNGVLVIDDNEKWNGKALIPGEKLFEIVDPYDLIAEIYVNESNSSVLDDSLSLNLYLHNEPGKGIKGQVISVSPKPIISETGQYCYLLKVKIENNNKNYIMGMRGIARVSGDKVSLAYFIFKSSILWWRKV